MQSLNLMNPQLPFPKFKAGDTAYLRDGTMCIINFHEVRYEYGCTNPLIDEDEDYTYSAHFPADERDLLTPEEYFRIKTALDDLPF